MPVVNVNWWKGAGEPERRQLVSELTETVSRLAKCPPEAVTVLISDVEKDHWGIGGKLAADL
ncbi:4-oxalocrotonate tautomerase [Amycolatopsis xylanica]|uniref:Tautomerase n=1 Tax=Amycolatopsis xylanica TaxID=589385 RepID=A0A1H2UWN3_9PSEU|nr:4-oxalocrotonate tautomerase family protein [Amycolatopsis xylanica]SDW60506.1 4-oxalocrotonate tautomerase [Amycolatopsis xylanica]